MFKGKKTYLIPIISFALVMLIGAVLLTIPSFNNINISFADALYTSVSGVTTTGLLKGNMIAQFNFGGQLVFAILMEIGALGFVIFVSYFWSIRNKKISMSDAMVINDSLSGDNTGSIKEHTLFIGKLVLIIQLAGTILLAIRFVPLLGFFEGLWYSIFHVISAFSNTGVDLFGENGIRVFVNDFYVQIVLILLMVAGSFGVFAIEDIKNTKKFSKFKLQTKIIIVGTIFMLVVPTILLKLIQPEISLTNGLFLTAARSTGFDILDISKFNSAAQVIIMVIMFIGSSPASTGGGVKLVTMAVIISTLISTLKGKEETIIFWRKIPNYTVRMAFTIFILFSVSIFIALILFMNYNNIGIEKVLFDCISAISNTGFSLVSPNELNSVGSLVLIALMYIGRIGPLSLVLVFVNKDNKEKFVEYPEEKVIL
ncbi:MAG: hypothetical protein IKJ36_00135 [Clostridia bacterium]|nr:hypothetical protein [Clostridia bacterium]